MAEMKCMDCLRTVPFDAIFCPYCGKVIKEFDPEELEDDEENYTLIYKGESYDIRKIVTELRNGNDSTAYCNVMEDICFKISPYDPHDVDRILSIICDRFGIENPDDATKLNDAHQYTPRCPVCQSPWIRKIGAFEKGLAAGAFGWLSDTARSQFVCGNCGYKF